MLPILFHRDIIGTLILKEIDLGSKKAKTGMLATTPLVCSMASKGNEHTVTTTDTTVSDRPIECRFDIPHQDTPLALLIPPWGPGENVLQVFQVSAAVSPHKAAGPDAVSPRALKACATEVADVYRHLYHLAGSGCRPSSL